MLSFSSFCGALRAVYDSPTFDRAAMSAARYTTDRRELDFLWAIKPSKDNVLPLRSITQFPQAEFAARYGIPANTWRQWEWGRRRPPAYVVMLTAYAVFGDFITGALTSGEG